MNRDEAIELLRGGKKGIEEWNLRLRVERFETNFRGADLERADFRRVDLRNAELIGANLEECQLVGAKLNLAKMNGAN